MKEIFLVLAGAAAMYILLAVLSKKSKNANSETSTTDLKNLLLTPQTVELVKTQQFKNLANTAEFKTYLKKLSEEQIYLLANSLTQ